LIEQRDLRGANCSSDLSTSINDEVWRERSADGRIGSVLRSQPPPSQGLRQD